MPAARYWRAVGLQSVGGGALELSALHLYLGGARVDAAATLTSTFAPASGTLAALQDTGTATTARWLDVSAPGFALVWDFGVGNAQDVGAVRLGAGALYTEWLETLTLQHSSDGVAWETLGYVAGLLWPGASALQGVPADGDPHFDKVSLLLHMNGADGSTTFTDSSLSQKTVSSAGNAAISPAKSKWGGASLLLDGSGDYLSCQGHDDFVFGTGDFTVELWINTTTTAEKAVVDQFQGPGTVSWQFSIKNGKLNWFSSGVYALVGSTPVNTGAWHHIAATRSSGTLRLFVDGTLDGAVAHGTNYTTELVLGIGAQVAWRAALYDLPGNIDDLRITKGVARYTASFTPPDAPFGNLVVGAVVAPPLQRAPVPERARIAASAPVPPHSTLSAPRLLTARNVEFAGSGTASATGTIYGSTAIKGSPNAPVRAKVSLLRARDLLLVQQTWSDPTTGAYAFHGLDPAEKYTTLAEYPTGDRRAVAADQLTPDIEEARAP